MKTQAEFRRRRMRGWTPDTRFGEWFQRTDVWRRYVLAVALDELQAMQGSAPRFGRLLDAGCGAGLGFAEITQRFEPDEIVGVDVDPQQVRRAMVTARESAIPVRLVRAELSRMPVQSRCFDVVLCHQTLHHVTNASGVLAEFFRLLRPGGLLLLAESCRPFLESIPVRVLFRHPAQGLRKAGAHLDLLRSTGFEVLRTATPRPFWSEPVVSLRTTLGFSRKALREPKELLVVARRPFVSPNE
ncbi:MAG: class I SAM-dependent methyltransferase [Deltaproteobacteria bacterium]|nr:class I SAM-dependent methyltransferase [Deltaproteobacteria bacterium]